MAFRYNKALTRLIIDPHHSEIWPAFVKWRKYRRPVEITARTRVILICVRLAGWALRVAK